MSSVWGWYIPQGKDKKVTPFPMDCETCKELQAQEMNGCGEPGEREYNYTGATEPYNKICPRWFIQQPFVLSVHQELKDYERGALGIVNKDIGSATLEYLRALEIEKESWKQENIYNDKGK